MTDRVTWLDRGWQNAFIGACCSEEAWNHQMKVMEITGEKYPSKAHARVTTFDTDDKCIMLVTFPTFGQAEDPVTDIGLLFHEAVHVFDICMSNMGEHNPGPEVKAYGIQIIGQYLVWAFLDYHRKNIKWRKRKTNSK